MPDYAKQVTDDAIIAALKECPTNVAAARKVGLSERRFYRRKKLLALKGWSPEHGLTHPVADGQKLRGASTLYDADGKMRLQWVKSKEDPDRIRAIIDECVAASLDDLPRLKSRPAGRASKYIKDRMACYPIGDAHIGMRAWDEECGENWDLAIAERVQCQAMANLVADAPPTERAAIINLGDWFHYDNIEAITTRSGNVLDVDGRYAKMVRVGIKVMRQCIESALSRHRYVSVVNVIGNHDDTGAIWLAQALAHMYERNARVTIDTRPTACHYFEFGQVLVGLHHGHSIKMEALPAVMAADQPAAWGRCSHRYWWTGHIHHQQVKEFPGCIVESFNTLAAKDAYAALHGYRAQRNMKCIVLHNERGEVHRHTELPAIGESERPAPYPSTRYPDSPTRASSRCSKTC